MEYLFSDPRPDLSEDSDKWTRLFKLIPALPDRNIAELLLKRLWTLRGMGVEIKSTTSGLKLIPLIGPNYSWENEKEFEELKMQYLRPYAAEIKELLRRVNEVEN